MNTNVQNVISQWVRNTKRQHSNQVIEINLFCCNWLLIIYGFMYFFDTNAKQSALEMIEEIRFTILTINWLRFNFICLFFTIPGVLQTCRLYGLGGRDVWHQRHCHGNQTWWVHSSATSRGPCQTIIPFQSRCSRIHEHTSSKTKIGLLWSKM